MVDFDVDLQVREQRSDQLLFLVAVLAMVLNHGVEVLQNGLYVVSLADLGVRSGHRGRRSQSVKRALGILFLLALQMRLKHQL